MFVVFLDETCRWNIIVVTTTTLEIVANIASVAGATTTSSSASFVVVAVAGATLAFVVGRGSTVQLGLAPFSSSLVGWLVVVNIVFVHSHDVRVCLFLSLESYLLRTELCHATTTLCM